MKILLCIDHFGPGGAQRQLVNLADGLQRRGHHVEFFVYHPDIRHFAPMVEELGIKVNEYRKARRWSLGPVVELARLIRAGGYDAVLAFLRTPSVYAELASVVVGDVPLVVSERFMFIDMSASQRARQELHRLARWITVNSHHQREKMEKLFPWMKPKISTIYNGVDLESFFPPTPSVGGGSESEPLKLLAVGNTARKKNALGLARALAIIGSRGRPVATVSWVGAASTPAQKSAMDAVDGYIESHGLEDRWTWLGKRDDIPSLMRSFDALIHPAHFEGLPNAICEALASGLPVLASDVCDHPRLITGGRGLLFDPDQPAEIAETIVEFKNLPREERSEMSRRSRAFAERHLSLERYAREYDELLAGLLGGKVREPITDRAG